MSFGRPSQTPTSGMSTRSRSLRGTSNLVKKLQIVDSFARALVGMLRRGVPINDWYLVLPLDSTLET